MTWTYDPTLATDKDRVRFLIGDTDTTDQQLANEEITYLLTVQSNVMLAAANAASGLAAKYARKADTSIGDLSISASQRAAAYLALYEQLKMQAHQAGILGGRMFVGGLTVSGKESLADDTDAVQPNFAIGMQDRNSIR